MGRIDFRTLEPSRVFWEDFFTRGFCRKNMFSLFTAVYAPYVVTSFAWTWIFLSWLTELYVILLLFLFDRLWLGWWGLIWKEFSSFADIILQNNIEERIQELVENNHLPISDFTGTSELSTIGWVVAVGVGAVVTVGVCATRAGAVCVLTICCVRTTCD